MLYISLKYFYLLSTIFEISYRDEFLIVFVYNNISYFDLYLYKCPKNYNLRKYINHNSEKKDFYFDLVRNIQDSYYMKVF